jgi:hypothetical protein
MWKLLEERYGGQNVEDAHVIIAFKAAPALNDSTMKELERIYDVISVQYKYYKKHDPASLKAERSLLFQMAKEKLNPEFSMKFVRHTTRNNYIPNIIALKNFLKAEFLIAQTTEREYKIHTKTLDISQTRAQKHDQEGNEDQNEGNTSPQAIDILGSEQSDDYSFYIQNNRTGQRFEAPDFRKFQNFGSLSYGNPMYQPDGTQQALTNQRNTSGNFTGGLQRPKPPISRYKEGQCSCCQQAHTLANCPKFKNLSFTLQSVIIRQDRICYHCLNGVHFTRDCKINEGKLCGIGGCKKYHHKVLHRDPKSKSFIGNQIDDECEPKEPTQEELRQLDDLV